MTIDGRTQTEFVDTPVIELNGLFAGGLVDGLRITAGNSTVRGLAIVKFGSVAGSDGIEIQGGSNNVIEGNFIGVDVTGGVFDPDGIPGNGDEYGNAGSGVYINGSSNNTIGGTAGVTPGGPCTGACNILSGAGRGSSAFSDANGVEIAGAGSTGNVVLGNMIGVDIEGTLDFGNRGDGVNILSAGNNTIGGSASGAGNTISGNSSDGVEITGAGATGNRLEGNYIGTGATGTSVTRNGLYGVYINGASGNIIGGTASGGGNVISGNLIGIQVQGASSTGNVVQGNYIGTDVTGSFDLGNIGNGIVLSSSASSNTIGGTAAGTRNVISGNNSDGVEITGAATGSNTLQGNYIGTNVGGTSALPNGQILSNSGSGIRVNGSPNNTIGGTVAGARNVISGNVRYGMEIRNAGANGTIVRGNYIGTDQSGAAALGNRFDGIYVNGAPNVVIGGTAAGARNVISGNGAVFVTSGITIIGSGATGAQVQGNLVGADVSGANDLGNSGNGVNVIDGSGSLIGGTTAAARNIISGNGVHGVEIDSTGPTGNLNNLVQGNYIGLSINGNTALGNGGNGVYISDAPGNTIGGDVSGARNVISANVSMGVDILGSLSSSNLVQGNYIGTDANGSADRGNAQHGVFINASAEQHRRRDNCASAKCHLRQRDGCVHSERRGDRQPGAGEPHRDDSGRDCGAGQQFRWGADRR